MILWPTKVRRITSKFNLKRVHPILGGISPHYGLDIAQKGFHEIYASAPGGVVRSYTSKTYGECVVIEHEIRGALWTTLYAHMRSGSRRVKAGDYVTQGQQIGIMGATGRVTGQHLHFEVHKGKMNGVTTAVDPQIYLEEKIVKKQFYIVRPGDTISHIANKTNVSANELVSVNAIKDRNKISIGQKLVLPGDVMTMKFHVVKRGDTLSKIAKDNHSSVERLVKINKIKNKNLINIGQKIRIL